METDQIDQLTAALRTVCAELDALSQGERAPDAAPAPGPENGSQTGPQAARNREAVRALDALLPEVPR